MFKAITSDNLDRERLLFLSKMLLDEFGDKPASVLCLDFLFHSRKFNLMMAKTPTEVHETLSAFLRYAEVLNEAAFMRELCFKAGIQKLFGFTASQETGIITIFAGTLLHKAMKVKESNSITEWAFTAVPILQQVIKDRLRDRTLKENWMCQRCPAFLPCPVYVVSGVCDGSRRMDDRGWPLCKKGHGVHANYTVFLLSSFKTRLRILMLQILILNTAQYTVPRPERRIQQRYVTLSVYGMRKNLLFIQGSGYNIYLRLSIQCITPWGLLRM